MKVITNKVRLNKSQKEAFTFLQDISNYQQLMPDDTKSFDIYHSKDGFAVRVGSLPKVGMKLKEYEEYNKIIFQSPNSEFDYSLVIEIEDLENNYSDVQLFFDGKFNAMIEMIAKKPLTSFIETIAEKLKNI